MNEPNRDEILQFLSSQITNKHIAELQKEFRYAGHLLTLNKDEKDMFVYATLSELFATLVVRRMQEHAPNCLDGFVDFLCDGIKIEIEKQLKENT